MYSYLDLLHHFFFFDLLLISFATIFCTVQYCPGSYNKLAELINTIENELAEEKKVRAAVEKEAKETREQFKEELAYKVVSMKLP